MTRPRLVAYPPDRDLRIPDAIRGAWNMAPAGRRERFAQARPGDAVGGHARDHLLVERFMTSELAHADFGEVYRAFAENAHHAATRPVD